MKWIGQHIYDLVSRFRDDVYLEDLTTTRETNVLVIDSNGLVSKSTSLADDIIESEIDTLAGLTNIGATGINTLISSDDVQMYNPVNNGNPTFSIGANANERFIIQSVYDSGAQTLDYVDFKSFAASGTANKGAFKFTTDESHRLTIDDGGIDFAVGRGISINGTDILTDSSGTATLSNIDALDATTAATILSHQVMHYRFMGYGQGDGTNYFLGQPFTDAQSPWEHADSSSADGTTIPAGGGTNISELIRSGGHVMPRGCTLKKWTGWGTYNGSDNAFVSIYKWTPVDDDNTDITPVLLDTATIDGEGNDKVRSFAETSFTQASVAAGDIIFTQVKTETNNKTIYFNSTLEVEF